MKKAIVAFILLSVTLTAQQSGTPDNIRVKTDSNGYLLVSEGVQASPVSQPTTFSNTRLRTDASNNLIVAIAGLLDLFTVTAVDDALIVVNSTTTTDPAFSGLSLVTEDETFGLSIWANNSLRSIGAGPLSVNYSNPDGVQAFFTGGVERLRYELDGQITTGADGKGGATTNTTGVKKVTAIADNTPTTVLTVTVPNSNNAASVKLRFVSSNGSTDAFESTRTAEGTIVLTRVASGLTVATVLAISDATIATVAAGATHTLAYSATAMVGANNATQTFTIQVTIDDSGNTGGNQIIVNYEVINAEATGVTVS